MEGSISVKAAVFPKITSDIRSLTKSGKRPAMSILSHFSGDKLNFCSNISLNLPLELNVEW
jgi:hypothetical protein